MLLITMCLHLSLSLFSLGQPPGPKFPWPLWQSVGDVMIHDTCDMNIRREYMNRRFYTFYISQADEKVIKLKKSSVQALNTDFLSKLEAGGHILEKFALPSQHIRRIR